MSYNQIVQPDVRKNFGSQGYKERWKRDFFPVKISKHVPVKDRLKKFKKTATDQSFNKKINHRLQLHKSSNNSLYGKDFQHKPMKVIRKTKEMVEQSREEVKVDCSETFKTSYRNSFVEKDHTSVKGRNLAERSKDCSVNRIKPVKDTLSSKSGYEKDFGGKKFDTLHDTDSIRSTADLTTGSIKRIVGYMGHVPEQMKIEKKLGMERNYKSTYYTKTNPNIPGYSGYVPSSLENFKEKPFKIDRRTLKETDYCAKPVDPYITKKHGLKHYTLKEFFSMPDTCSQDGLVHAHKYFKNFRPLEGAPKI